jgi:hypothetical protein
MNRANELLLVTPCMHALLLNSYSGGWFFWASGLLRCLLIIDLVILMRARLRSFTSLPTLPRAMYKREGKGTGPPNVWKVPSTGCGICSATLSVLIVACLLLVWATSRWSHSNPQPILHLLAYLKPFFTVLGYHPHGYILDPENSRADLKKTFFRP